jgi:peptidoglycan/xylan/chitin deacetylase (PgdA/CDA1 family)
MRILLIAFILLLTSCASRQKVISISFDDTPTRGGWKYKGAKRTEALIANLKKAKVKRAAFYVKTKNLKTNEDIYRVQKYFLSGHMIGNHTHSHLSADKVKMKDFLKDVVIARKTLNERKLYHQYFRYPFLHRGQKPHLLKKTLETMGLKDGYVTIDNYDWYMDYLVRKSKSDYINLEALKRMYVDVMMDAIEFYDNIAEKHISGDFSHVLLLHENDLAAEFIDDLVVALRNKGWKIVVPEEAYFQSSLDEIPDKVKTLNQGRVIAHAIADGYKGPIRSKYESKDKWAALFKEYGVFSNDQKIVETQVQN